MKDLNAKIEQNIQQKEKATHGVKAKLVKKNQLAKEQNSSEETMSEETTFGGQIEEAESVSERLAQYEIKLARAKQAAHQLWH